ncbi:MAG: serine hydrolase [Phycisphaerae bacterium]|nr:MAG: serine hydrolase [Phycisphaerae bacterium]
MHRTIQQIQHGLEQKLYPGMQIFVWHRGRTVLDEAYGYARPGIKLTPDSRMLWMSAGKPVTAVAVMQLVQRGLLDLETRVSRLIPEFAQNGKQSITIFHLLTHTGGFRGPLNSFTPGTWDQIVQRCCSLRQEPGWVPGQKAGYHVASSWFILGEIVRRVDSRSIDRYVRESVFAPVGATDCWIGMPESVVREDDALVEPDFPGNQVIDAWTTPRPPANARGPIRQLGLWYVSLLQQDDRLLNADWVSEMIRRQRTGMFDETFKQVVDWGLGFKLDSKRYGRPESYGYGPYASETTFGHSGNQCSCAFADPENELVVAWCCNGMPGEDRHQVRQEAIHRAIYEDLGLTGASDHSNG